ncbi:MAG: flap endonuclease-1 [Candidatus Woesearchaeota archaeon]
MGVKLTELLIKRRISFDDLKSKVIAIDAPLFLYQFLTTIRQPDGKPFTDSNGRITSHLMGLLTRTINFLNKGIKPVFVFEGKSPELKHRTQKIRAAQKEEAIKMYEDAVQKGLVEEARKYASRISRITPEMIEESKNLLVALGIPFVDAPSEAEAQASFMVKKGDCFAVSSQDEDSLMFGASRLVMNLSVTGKRKVQNKISYEKVEPEMILLDENLNNLGIDNEQLIVLCILIGTDYNPGGVFGIGQRKALELVKKHGKNFEALFKDLKWEFDFSWKDVFETIKNIPITEKYSLSWQEIDAEKVLDILLSHDFSEERVKKLLEPFLKKQSQKNLKSFFS